MLVIDENQGLLLESAGKSLFGPKWHLPLKEALGVQTTKRIRQWRVHGRPVPDGVWKDIVKLLEEADFKNEQLIEKIRLICCCTESPKK